MKRKRSKSNELSTQELIKRTQEVEDENEEKKRIRLEKREEKEKKCLVMGSYIFYIT